MVRLKRSEALKRLIRADDLADLGIPTWDLIRQAIEAGNKKDALAFLEYAQEASQRNNDTLTSFIDDALTHLASTFGEEELEKVFRKRYQRRAEEWAAAKPTAEEALQRCVDSQRGHHASFTVVEEKDRYVMTYDPCGTGGRLRRSRKGATTKKAYPWSFGKSGIPYYCCHCCIHWEILPTELQGYPVKITLPGNRPEDPCVHYLYKRPELIPEEYFTRIGKKKTIK
ncbi:MAG: hypothetical protein V1737_05760 [Chloroflexota bacterium]